MAGQSGTDLEAREPREKRSRDESESPRRGTKRISTGEARAEHKQRQEMPAQGIAPKSKTGIAALAASLTADAQANPPRDPPQNEERSNGQEQSSEPPRKRRRPGPSGGISKAQREANIQQAAQREAERKKREDEWAAQQIRSGIHDAVKEHYNMVPQRGREWRRTESRIKGLREFNNWIKSVMIQRFSPDHNFIPSQLRGRENSYGGWENGLKVLDLGCGKGGDLFKWQKAPQRVDFYVGIDPANVSIQQARDRYKESSRNRRGPRMFEAHFFDMDAYGRNIGVIDLIRPLIDPEVGPGARGNPRFGGGGFDVVSMMFCLHYAFESEEKARGMLRNVAGALKKGGRLVGVMPSSDIIRSGLTRFYKDWERKWAAKKKAEAAKTEDETKTNGEAKKEETAPLESTTAPESPPYAPDSPAYVPDSPGFIPDSPTYAPGSPDATPGQGTTERKDKGHTEGQTQDNEVIEDVPENPEPEWGNSLYKVRLQARTPRNGVFRPMYGWKYTFKLEEAVEEVPEYIVPFEGFRALAEEYNLELTYSKPFMEIFEENRGDRDLGPLSVRMGVTDRVGGELRMSNEEKEAASFYLGFVFVKL